MLWVQIPYDPPIKRKIKMVQVNHKIYVISRKDLNAGSIAVQGMHALTEFLFKYPEQSQNWYKNSNSIVFLQASVEDINNLILSLNSKNIKYAEFYEPDWDNALTAICIEPENKTKKLCYHFKLALKRD